MGSVLLFDAVRMQEIEDTTVVAGFVDVDGHLLLEQRNGTTIDAGSVIGPAGADADLSVMGIAYRTAATAPSTYPTGFTYLAIPTTFDDWPIGLATVMTVKYSLNRMWQQLVHKADGRVWVRADDTGDIWGPWREVTGDSTTTVKGITRYATSAETVAGAVSTAAITPAGLAAAGGKQFTGKNRLINSAFRTNQRLCVSGVWLVGSNLYTFDRWKFFGAINLASNPIGVIPGTGNTTIGWGGLGGAFSVLTGLTIPGLAGVTTAVRGVALAGDTGGVFLNGSLGRTISVVAGGLYRFSWYIRSSVAKTVSVNIQWAGASGSTGNTIGTPVALAANTWTRVDVQGTAPAGSIYGGPYSYQTSGVWAAGNTVDVTGVLVENNTVLTAYYPPPSLTFAAAPQGQAVTVNNAFLAQVIERTNIEAGTYTVSGFTGFVTVFNEGSVAPAFQASPATFTVDGTQNVYVLFSAGTVLNQVQFEKGTVATPYEYIPISEELALCHRYYWRFTASVQAALFTIGWFTTTAAYGVLLLPQTMRTLPTFSISGQTGATLAAIVNGSSATVSAILFAQISERSARVLLTTSSAPVNAAGWTEITTSSWVEANAEL